MDQFEFVNICSRNNLIEMLTYFIELFRCGIKKKKRYFESLDLMILYNDSKYL